MDLSFQSWDGDLAHVSATVPPSLCLNLFSAVLCKDFFYVCPSHAQRQEASHLRKVSIDEGEGEMKGRDGERSGRQLDRSVNPPRAKDEGDTEGERMRDVRK